MRNQEVINIFVNENKKAKSSTGNLYILIDEAYGKNRLMNYATCIAERNFFDKDCEFVINDTKYSVSTSKIQTWLRSAISQKGSTVRNIIDIRFNTQHLQRL